MSHEDEKTIETPSPRSAGATWDPWRGLSAWSRARIGLGRAGAASRTEVHLAFQAAHAAARDAVQMPWHVADLVGELGAEVATHTVASRAHDRQTYLLRPDLGRQLADDCRDELRALRRPERPWDVALVVSNGLSTEAVRRHGGELVRALLRAFEAAGLDVAPVVLVPEARVALGDPIGGLLLARVVVVVLGERPGLSAADSLGIYLTLLPAGAAARTDADRNCISNVHPPDGLDYAQAAAKCVWLVNEALARGYSGVQLKDESPSGLVLLRSLGQ